jgi:hypothetical protein
MSFAMSTALAVSHDTKTAAEFTVDPCDPGAWRVFARALRARQSERPSWAPLEIGGAISIAALFSANLAAPFFVQLGLLTASAGIFCHAFGELGNPWLERLVFTVGRRPCAPDELRKIMESAPTPQMRARVKNIVSANAVVRHRHMLPLRIEAKRTLRQLKKDNREKCERELADARARARNDILNTKT